MRTRYLYGDSSPASFDYDAIEMLRDTLVFSVEVLSAYARVQQLRNQELALRNIADAESKKLGELNDIVARALAPVSSGTTATCAAKILAATESVVASDIAGLRGRLTADVQALGVQEGNERDSMLRSFEALLARHDLPGAKTDTAVVYRGGRYVARTSMVAEDLGVSAQLDCEPPQGHALAQAVRVEKLSGPLELQVPESGGFFRKEVRPRPQRIEKLHVAASHHDEDGVSVSLRTEPDGSGVGYDVTITGPSRDVTIARLVESDPTPARFDLDKGDLGKLVTFVDAWSGLVDGLMKNRVRLVEAMMDGEAYRDFDEPTVLVERLIEAIAPDIQEIARRTPGKNELVIKRVIEGNRREEIFLSKSELKEQLEKLPSQTRNLFRPLGLEAVMPSLLPPPSLPRASDESS